MISLEEITHKLTQLKQPIIELINQYTRLSEHDLMGYLQKPPYNLIDKQVFRRNDSLFCAHFLIRHLLYVIQTDWYHNQKAYLHIDSKYIHKQDLATHNSQQLSIEDDKLRAYYLNLEELITTDSAQVETLLTSFWARFISYQQGDESLACLGLQAGVSLADIEHRYRQLAMQHHPDKGGDAAEFAKISQAYQHLKQSRQ